MASADALVRLILDTSDFDSKLVKSKKGANDLGNSFKTCGEVMKTAGSALAKVAGALGITTSAMKVASDAFMSSESNVDAWGETVSEAQGLYEHFVESLNNADLSEFLEHIQDIVSSAKDAYDALDDLETKGTIHSPQLANLSAERTQQMAIIRQYGKNSAKGKAAQKRLLEISDELKETYAEQGEENLKVFRSQVNAKLGGMKLTAAQTKELWATFNDPHAFDMMISKASGEIKTVWKSANGAGSYKTTEDTRNFEAKMRDMFTDEWRKKWSPYYTAYFNSKGQAASLDLGNTRYTKNDSSSGRKSSGPFFTAGADSIKEMSDNVSYLKKELESLTVASDEYDKVLAQLVNWQVRLNQAEAYEKSTMSRLTDARLGKKYKAEEPKLTNTLDKDLTTSQGNSRAFYEDIIGNYAQYQISKMGQEIVGQAKSVQGAWNDAAGAIGQCGSALASFGDHDLNIAGTVLQAIANIALAFSTAVSEESAKGGLWGMIAGVTGGMAAMISAVAAIHNVSGYAEGGVVGGNSYSGDRLYARLNSGETVLTQEQAARANSMLDSRGGGASTISGEQIVTVINAYGRRTHRGEILK